LRKRQSLGGVRVDFVARVNNLNFAIQQKITMMLPTSHHMCPMNMEKNK